MEYLDSALYVLKCHKTLEEDQVFALPSPAAEHAASYVNPPPS